MSETETAFMIDGKELADELLNADGIVVKALRRQTVVPGLAILNANDSDIAREVCKGINDAAEAAGIRHDQIDMFPAPEVRVLIREVERLNRDDTIHGIYVQLPSGYSDEDMRKVFDTVSREKDVNCHSAYGIGASITGKHVAGNIIYPCSTSAVMEIIHANTESIAGLHVVLVGCDESFVKPLADEEANVTLVNPEETADLSVFTKTADILVVFMGVPGAITGDMIAPGAIVIDCGYTKDDDGNIVGDVDAESVSQVAAALTYVPNGVMPVIYERFVAHTIWLAYEYGKKPFGQCLTPLDYQEIQDFIDDATDEEPDDEEPGDTDEKDLC